MDLDLRLVSSKSNIDRKVALASMKKSLKLNLTSSSCSLFSSYLFSSFVYARTQGTYAPFRLGCPYLRLEDNT